jgi:DNA primase
MADLELIKSKLDIVEIISNYVPGVKRAGVNYKANCPFHNEKTPSFTINPSLQIYKCFGCGKGGDVISFIKEIERVEFGEAIKIAAEKAGVELSENTFKPNTKEQEEKKKIIEANTLSAKFYHYILTSHKTGKKGRDYAQKRGIDGERIKTFLMGYAPATKDNLKKFLVSKGFNENDLVRWGLLVEREKGKIIDKFRDRLLHPIFNLKGEVVAFSGRYIGDFKDAPKYLNSPETLVYKKNESLYGFYQAKEAMRKAKFVIVEEGNVDILSSHRVGIENIVAPLGTAFTPNQAKLLKRFVDEIYFCFDTDIAGQNALIKSMAICEEIGIKHRVIDIGDYKDPDELIQSEPELWKVRVSESVNTVEYLIKQFTKGIDLSNADAKSKFSNKILPVLRMVKDPILQPHYIKEVAILMEVTEDTLTSVVNNVRPKNKLEKEEQRIDSQPEATTTNILEEFFLSMIAASGNTLNLDVKSDYFENSTNKKIFTELTNLNGVDPASIYDKLTDDERKVFERIMLFDSSTISNLVSEIKSVGNRIKENYLKVEILKLRKEVAQNLEEKKLEKLQALVQELKNLKTA